MMFGSGICCVDKAIRFLFCETCHALDGDPSKISAAKGDKNTGGRFSYINVFQNDCHENSIGS